MTRRCTICGHSQRAEIDSALLKGEQSLRRIAAQYGVAETSLRRHKAAHLPAALVAAKGAEEAARADDLLAQARELQARALDLLAQAESDGDLKTALQGVREARGCLELLARLLGELNERPQVNILIHPEWLKIRAALVAALAPYPEAKRKVVEALQHVGA